MSVGVAEAVQTLEQGGVICHACEGVWGLGCDAKNETAVRRILAIKNRPESKGLIVLGSTAASFEPELQQLTSAVRKQIEASWPGPTTWLVPNSQFGRFITGDFSTVAVRIPSHTQALAICSRFGKPIVSTSANLSGASPCKSEQEAVLRMGKHVDCVVSGKIGDSLGPSTIFDATSGQRVR